MDLLLLVCFLFLKCHPSIGPFPQQQQSFEIISFSQALIISLIMLPKKNQQQQGHVIYPLLGGLHPNFVGPLPRLLKATRQWALLIVV